MPKSEQTELQKFFPSQNEAFSTPAENALPLENEELPEDLKNRHVRRLEQKVQAEREANIAMAARLEALSEAQKFQQDTGADELEQKVARIYGTDSPEKAEATRILQESFKGYAERAKNEALETFRAERKQAEADTQKEVATLESYIEQIEDQFGVDLSSTAEARERRSQYVGLLEKLSPKKDGEVIDYADPFEVWDIFKSRQPQDRSKEMASRGMVRSRNAESSIETDPLVKQLQEQGLLNPF